MLTYQAMQKIADKNPVSKQQLQICITRPQIVSGGKCISTEQLLVNFPELSVEETIVRTGIRTRYWSNAEENVVSLAIRASQLVFDTLDEHCSPISGIICSTSTPREATPSIACQVASHFRDHEKLAKNYLAFDVNAACSGFLYALGLAHDRLVANPGTIILLITSEVISPLLNPSDRVTSLLYGDAASACLVTGKKQGSKALKINPPLLLASPDTSNAVHIPCAGSEQFFHLDTLTASLSVYKSIRDAVQTLMQEAPIKSPEISACVFTPVNSRILQQITEHLDLPVSRVRIAFEHSGNTLSSSIPLSLDYYWDELPATGHILFASFGAGFTSAAMLAEFIDETQSPAEACVLHHTRK
jgi:2-oxoisovalerate dehydrogenase E1 component